MKKKKPAKKKKSVARAPRAKKELPPKIVFVGGKWYNEKGQRVPKPKPKPIGCTCNMPLGLHDDDCPYGDKELTAGAGVGPQNPTTEGSARTAVTAQRPAPFLRYDEKRIEGCTCAQPSLTGHVPGCRYYRAAMYNCEGANPETMKQLVQNLPVPSFVDPSRQIEDVERLQFERLTANAFPVVLSKEDANADMARRKRICSSDLIQTDVPRRRCWMCPFWDRHKEITPFDSQKQPQESLSDFPKALEDDDDDLPF